MNQSFESVLIAVQGHVATVTLRAIGKANRMGPAFWREMPDVFASLDAAPEVRAIVLRGEGDNFSFGLDLSTMTAEIAPALADGALARERLELLAVIERMQRAMTGVASCSKPVIAAVAGHCIGGGVDLITACDIRVCSANARFSVREVRLAMVADMGTLARLPAIVGQGVARELAFTGDDIDAARALRIGLVNEVYPTDDALFEAAHAMAARIAGSSPIAVRGIKRVMNTASEKAADESLRTVAIWNAAFLSSHDLREAFAAFAQKRPAKFEGR